MRLCDNGCGERHHAGGYCSRCYKRLLRSGTPPLVRPIRPAGLSAADAIRWFGWTEVDRDWTPVDTACWEWDGSRDRQGYGTLYFNGTTRKVPRLAWQAWNGALPPDLWVLHNCDNPPCLNPDHLRIGTRLDNARDAVERGRYAPQRHGEDHHFAVRTAEEIREIRRLYATGEWTYARLGERFQTDFGYIGRIIRREIWTHVDLEDVSG